MIGTKTFYVMNHGGLTTPKARIDVLSGILEFSVPLAVER